MGVVLTTPLAREDLGDIWDYAAESGEERADRLLDLINEKCRRLAEYPELGRARHELLVNLRSFTVKNGANSCIHANKTTVFWRE